MRRLETSGQSAVRSLAFAAPVCVLALALLVGCSGKVVNDNRAEGFDPTADGNARYAVGGFVLGAGVELDRKSELGAAYRILDVREQTDAWAPELYGALLDGARRPVVWAWPAVRDNIPSDTITALQLAYAAHEDLDAEQLAGLAADLPEITYLVLARLDRNELQIGSNAPGGLGSQVVDDSRDPHGTADLMSRAIKTRRTVEVSLDVFELGTGRVVWSGHTEQQKTELFNPAARDDGAELVVVPPRDEGGTPEIRVKGASLPMPELEGLLREACTELAKNLFGARN